MLADNTYEHTHSHTHTKTHTYIHTRYTFKLIHKCTHKETPSQTSIRTLTHTTHTNIQTTTYPHTNTHNSARAHTRERTYIDAHTRSHVSHCQSSFGVPIEMCINWCRFLIVHRKTSLIPCICRIQQPSVNCSMPMPALDSPAVARRSRDSSPAR